MSLEPQALTTLDTLKAELGITGSTYDARLERLINGQSKRLAELIGRALHYEVDLIERVRGWGGSRLELARAPIVEIDAVAIVNGAQVVTIDASEYEIERADLGWVLRLYGVWDSRVRAGLTLDPTSNAVASYRVTYTAGWVTPQQAVDDVSLTRNLPSDIEDAVLALCGQRWLQDPSGQQVTGRKLLSGSISYAHAPQGGQRSQFLPDVVRDVVSSYGWGGAA